MLRCVLQRIATARKKIKSLRRDYGISSTQRLVHPEAYSVLITEHGPLCLILKRLSGPKQHWVKEPEVGNTSSKKALNALSSVHGYGHKVQLCEDGDPLMAPVSVLSPRSRPRSNSWSGSDTPATHRPLDALNPNVGSVMVHAFDVDENEKPRWHEHVHLGDILVSVNHIKTSKLTFKETIAQIQSSTRPLELEFYRFEHTAPRKDASEQVSLEALEKVEREKTQVEIEQVFSNFIYCFVFKKSLDAVSNPRNGNQRTWNLVDNRRTSVPGE